MSHLIVHKNGYIAMNLKILVLIFLMLPAAFPVFSQDADLPDEFDRFFDGFENFSSFAADVLEDKILDNLTNVESGKKRFNSFAKKQLLDAGKTGLFGEEISEGMALILNDIWLDVMERPRRGVCQHAAGKLAQETAWEAKHLRILRGAGRIWFDLLTTTIPGAPGLAKKLVLTPGRAALDAFRKLFDNSLKEGLDADKPGEIFEWSRQNGNCTIAMRVVWNKQKSAYLYQISGDCGCTLVRTSGLDRPSVSILMDKFLVVGGGNVRINQNDKLSIKRLHYKMQADCDCRKNDTDGRERIEQEESEDESRWEQEQKERELEAQRRKDEVQRRYEAEQRRIREKAREIAITCPICDPIRQHIADVTEQIFQKELKIPDLENAVADAEKDVTDSEKELQQARQKLDNFNNPDSWVESDGRRITSSDLEVQRELSREIWERYTSGEQSADETMENWENQFDPETLERAKERAEQRLEENVGNAEEAVRQANENLDQANQNLNEARQDLDRLDRLKNELERLLEECLEKCKLQAEDIARGRISDYTELLDIEEIVISLPEPEVQPESDPEPEDGADESPEPDEETGEEPESDDETTDEYEPEGTPETEETEDRDYEGLELTGRNRFTDRLSINRDWQWDYLKSGAKLDFATRGAFKDAVCNQDGISNCTVDNLTPVFVAYSEFEFAQWDLSDKGIGMIPISAGLSYTRSNVQSHQNYIYGIAGSFPYQINGSTNINTLDLYGHFRRDFNPLTELPLSPSFSPYIKLGISQIWNSGEFKYFDNNDYNIEKRRHNGLHFNGGFGTDIGFGGIFYTRLNADYTAGGADANLRFGLGVGFNF